MNDVVEKERFLFSEIIKGTFLKSWTYDYCKQRDRFSKTDEIDKRFEEYFHDLNQFNESVKKLV